MTLRRESMGTVTQPHQSEVYGARLGTCTSAQPPNRTKEADAPIRDSSGTGQEQTSCSWSFRIASKELLPWPTLCSPKLLPASYGTMNPSLPGRAHQSQEDACRAQRAGRRYPQQIPSGRSILEEFTAASGHHESRASEFSTKGRPIKARREDSY